ncbi:hypothetical protein ACTXT7_014399 [Hymenolepis weldensis]
MHSCVLKVELSNVTLARYFIRFAITTFLIYVSNSFMTFNSKSMKEWNFKDTLCPTMWILTDVQEEKLFQLSWKKAEVL